MNAINNLASERKRLGKTQTKAAEDLRISTKTLAKYESDPLTMPGEFIVRACKYYGCTASYLLGMSDERCQAVA